MWKPSRSRNEKANRCVAAKCTTRWIRYRQIFHLTNFYTALCVNVNIYLLKYRKHNRKQSFLCCFRFFYAQLAINPLQQRRKKCRVMKNWKHYWERSNNRELSKQSKPYSYSESMNCSLFWIPVIPYMNEPTYELNWKQKKKQA